MYRNVGGNLANVYGVISAMNEAGTQLVFTNVNNVLGDFSVHLSTTSDQG